MASSRVFVRGLPPTLSENDFKKHFSQQGTITDVRLFQNRRIGYIGYETPEVADKAVKYFNRTFMRMSKIAVEIATPVKAVQPQAQTIQTPAPVSTLLSTAVKRKHGSEQDGAHDPELVKFLETMRPAKSSTQHRPSATPAVVALEPAQSTVPIKRRKVEGNSDPVNPDTGHSRTTPNGVIHDSKQVHSEPELAISQQETQPHIDTRSDADWLRSRTSRLLGLDDDESDSNLHDLTHEPRPVLREARPSDVGSTSAQQMDVPKPVLPPDDKLSQPAPSATDGTEEKIQSTQRLYLRNLAYNLTEKEIQAAFSKFGQLIEVHLPMSSQTGTPKGFAYVQFNDADDAVQAWRALDGTTFKGRLIHILPATAKRETQLDEFQISKLPLKKQQQIKRRREAASTQYNWNSLFMNPDAVLSSIADRFGLQKGDILDPTSSDAAVKQAQAETHLIQETKTYFKSNGVDIDAFKTQSRGDTAILIKNIPYNVKPTEIRDLFEQHGKLKVFLMPPSGVIAIAAFEQPAHATAAFGALAYRKIQNSVLFLEKAPKNLFSQSPGSAGAGTVTPQAEGKPAISAADLLQNQLSASSATLFVRNLNFTTTSDLLMETFKPLDGFLTARVKTKIDSKKPGQVLSMGYGFVEFKSEAQAEAALATMDDYHLQNHRLQIKMSQKAGDAAETRRSEDQAKRKVSASTKIVIKNLPFEATKKDIRALFGGYGQLRSVRMPMKMDRSIRGFAFADFTTAKEAQNALDALSNTHLLGRRLVLDFAAPEAEDAEAEIAKMQKKVGSQINKVALQDLTGSGRKRFSIDDPAAEEDLEQ